MYYVYKITLSLCISYKTTKVQYLENNPILGISGKETVPISYKNVLCERVFFHCFCDYPVLGEVAKIRSNGNPWNKLCVFGSLNKHSILNHYLWKFSPAHKRHNFCTKIALMAEIEKMRVSVLIDFFPLENLEILKLCYKCCRFYYSNMH